MNGTATMTASARADGILDLIGHESVLIGWNWGIKGDERTKWKHLTQHHMTPQYLAALEDKNIGVKLGADSGGLCSIDIDRDEDVEPFLAINPKLRNTLRTRGRRGGNIWVRIEGEHPPLTTLRKNGEKFGEWRADGGQTIIDGKHPDGMPYARITDAPPIRMKFADIIWPDDITAKFLEANPDENLEALYGEPIHTASKDGGSVVTGVNQRYWGGLMLAENRILHEATERCFYLYSPDTGLWQQATDDRLVDMVCRRLFEHANEDRRFKKQLIKLISHSRAKPIVEMMRGMAERRNAFDERPRAIHVANGMIRFDGDRPTFDSFSPDFYSRNQSPIAYNDKAECRRFIDELLAPALTAEDIALLQKWIGVALYGINLPQRILLLDGTPGGGKSTLAKIIQMIVGAANCYQLRTDCLTKQFETFRYRGKTLLMGADVPGDFLEHQGATVLKALVGGDLFSCEQKGGNGDFHINGTFNVLITSNSRLRARLEGDTDAWRRRLMILRYDRPPVTKRVLEFDKMLVREEGSGILRWALAGFSKALEEFSESGDYAMTTQQKGRVDGLLAESDSINWFLRECVVGCEGYDITTGELTEAYAEFCAARGWTALPQTVITKQFDDLMLALFHTVKAQSIKRDGRAQRGWRRVRFKQEDEP